MIVNRNWGKSPRTAVIDDGLLTGCAPPYASVLEVTGSDASRELTTCLGGGAGFSGRREGRSNWTR